MLLFFTGNKDIVTDVAFYFDGKSILSAGHDSTIKIWRLDE